MIHGLRGVFPSKCFAGWGPQTNMLLKAHGTAGKVKSAQWNTNACLVQRLSSFPTCENYRGFIQVTGKLSWPQAFLPSTEHSCNPSLGLASLSASWIPKMSTFSYGQQPPGRPWRSEAGQRSWRFFIDKSRVPLPCSLWKTDWLGSCLNPTCSGCAGVWNHSAWEPGLNHSSNIAEGSEVIHCLKGCICCILLTSFIMAASDTLSLRSDYPKNLTGRTRQTSSILQPGNVLTQQVVIHELS